MSFNEELISTFADERVIQLLLKPVHLMASLHITDPQPSSSRVLNCDLPKCNRSLFDSSRFHNIKENILLGISSKWETFNDPATMPPTDELNGIGSTSRKSKIRSVYGQPEISLPCETQTNLTNVNWRSLDSLESTCDSGRGVGSNSTSCSDLRPGNDCIKFGASDLETSVESFDNELDSCNRSYHSSSSGCSIETADDEINREAKLFMKNFVDNIFINSGSISLEEKAKFGMFARTESGRLWFARYITKQRNQHKQVSESTFYSLAQYFAIILFECSEADHFIPAKNLMNMCFTYYHQSVSRIIRNNGSNSTRNNQQYLYTVLRDQPIWRSVRFWNAAFFDSVQAERVTFFDQESRSSGTYQDRIDDWQFQANVSFGLLGTFTYNMHSFGLPKSVCFEFLHKQSTIANLTNEQVQLLVDNIKTMYGKCT